MPVFRNIMLGGAVVCFAGAGCAWEPSPPAGGEPSHARSLAAATPAATAWSDALDLPGDAVIATTMIGPSVAAQVRSDLGVIKPVRGGSFVLLSTGIAGSPAAEPGTDLGSIGSSGDAVTLVVDIQVPLGASKLSLQYNFLSAACPEFVGTEFNDRFSIQLIDASGTRTFTVASVNTAMFFSASSARAHGSGFDLFTADPGGVDTAFEGGLPDAGLTGFQVFRADVSGGGNLQLRFTIEDVGDGIVDSAVLLDALQFSAIELVDPNPDLLTARAGVTPVIDDLVTRGRPVGGAVADGVTKLLARMKVPGPGQVTFSLARTAADGALSAIDGGELLSTITTRAVFNSAREFYALALYHAPADFNRGGDEDLAERAVQISAAYTTDAGPGFLAQTVLQIERPPLVLAHGLWSSALDWTALPLASDPRFAITYAAHDYACDTELRVVPPATQCPLQHATAPDGIVLCSPDPGGAFAGAVGQALASTRQLGIAATRVDVVAHGAGGVHARQYIANPAYRRVSNFFAGDVNRLITVNTPHLGSVVANLITAGRDNPTGRVPRENLLCVARIQARAPVEPGDVDALQTSHVALQATAVPAHALVGSGGKGLTLQQATRKLGSLALLYSLVPQNEPVPIFGLGSAFGASDHDLFATVDSQRGGLPDSAVTVFAMSPTSPPLQGDSDQFHAMKYPPVSDRIVGLLNSPAAGPLFAPFPAAP